MWLWYINKFVVLIPRNVTESLDSDADGIGDNADVCEEEMTV
jgi:hypothetical protein